jgi:hypothetical protein
MLSRALFPGFGLVLAVACGGSSASFDDRTGDDGDSGTGGSSSGGGPTGGDAGTAPNGGSSGSATGGLGGTGFGGTQTGGSSTGGSSTGGSSTGGSSTGGSSTGGSATGGSATGGLGGSGGFVTGGTGGQTGGSAGVGGKPDERCPFRLPTGACEAEGLSCKYDLSRQCLCTAVTPPGICTAVDPRCTAMARIAPAGGAAGIAIPVALATCDCRSGTWACHTP